MAMTADGKIATANRRFSSFGSSHDQRRLYELRALADAVMSGSRTVEEENADLNSGGLLFQRKRRRRGLAEENLRIVVSGSGTLNPSSRIFAQPGGEIIVLTTDRASLPRKKALIQAGATVVSCGADQIDFLWALRWLHRERSIGRLHCEGGAELNDALFRADLVDEFFLTLSPWIFGGAQAPTIAEGLGVARLIEAAVFDLVETKRRGDELFLRYQRPSRSKLRTSAKGRRHSPSSGS